MLFEGTETAILVVDAGRSLGAGIGLGAGIVLGCPATALLDTVLAAAPPHPPHAIMTVPFSLQYAENYLPVAVLVDFAGLVQQTV